jgi:Cu(I)/Ag(I) efflux system membrane fusion protein
MNRTTFIATVAALIVGIGVGYFVGERGEDQAPTAAPSPGERQPLYYRNPMNPQITSPVPAQDEMGMDYIPVYADDDMDDAPAGTVRIDPVTRQNIGVRTARVEQRTLARVVNTVGRIDYDEQHLYRLHPKTEGWIEGLRVDTTGSEIRRGDILLSFYSPRLVSTQQEYLLALKNLDTLQASSFPDVARGAEQLLDTSLERLRLLDVPEHQIEDLRRTREVKKRLHIHAPAGGVVTRVGVRDGQYITPKDELYTIADLSRVWVFVDVYEDELPWVKIGDRADMTILAVPGEVFSGRLTYIYPYAESKTRTVKARLEFDNPELRLKPNMFANVSIQAGARRDVVAVPSEAIVRSGLREKVFVVREPGKFEPREVVVGVSSEGFTELREGIEVGEEVVVSAQFLIDSESNLREAAAKMQAIGSDSEETGHDHQAH